MSGVDGLRFYSMVLIVADLPRMRDWYARMFGFAESFGGAAAETASTFAIMKGAGTCIELVSRPGLPHQPVPVVDPPAHLDHLGWRTLDLEADDLRALDAHLRDAGAEILWSLKPVIAKRCSTLVRDPEGNLIAIFGSVRDA